MIHVRVQHQQRERLSHMRKTNNIDTINLAADAEEGRAFWILYDQDTQETLTSIDYDKHEWKPITLSTGDNWGLSEILPTARFSTLEEAQEVADEAADRLSEEYPDDEINLEIHMVSLEMVEMVRAVDCEAGKAKRAGTGSDEEEDEGDDWDVTSDDKEEEEDEGFEANRFNFNRQREALENLVISNKKPKAKKSTKKGKGRS